MLFQRSSFDDVLNDLCAGKLLPGEITGHHVRPATSARYGELPPDLHPALRDALAERGVARPYTHQAEAIARALVGRNTVLATPTASGKTLCFNVPVLQSILETPETRALYLFPTKALAQDQYAGVHQLISALTRRGHPVNAFTFDGDTPEDARRAVREHGHIVITNPDMLHAAVLPQHPKWMKLFENLRWIVIDELHTYRGVFGSHVAHLLRRLLRIARFHGSDPRIIACSATIANPVELAESLTGERFDLISESGGPTGEHHLVTYNPPVVNAELQIRAGVVRCAVQAASALIRAGVSTIVFAGSRLHVELILKYLREEMARHHLDPELVQGYRGGYLPLLRRKVEAGLRDGRIRCVVATNALEMGIDIGSLDASLIAGYPGSIASFRQQAGRAGRREKRSLTLFVAGSGALDQYLVTHPDHLVAQAAEAARINPRNLYVLMDHAKCAAYELPFVDGDAFSVLDQAETGEVLGHLTSHRVLHRAKDRWHWSDRSFPANHVNLRGVPEENFIVIDLDRDLVLAEVDFRSTHTTLHEHAIYHVDSKHYQVERLDYDDHKAFVRRVDPDYYTTAMTYTKVSIIQEDLRSALAPIALQRPSAGGARPWRATPSAGGPDAPLAAPHTVALALCSGEVVVTRKFVGFKKVRFHTNEVIGYGEIHLPDLEMHTTATWFDVPRVLIESLPYERDTVIDGLEVVAHALRTVSCVRLMCAERDLDRAVGETAGEAGPAIGLAMAAPSVERDPTIFLYDAMPGGVGLAPEIFDAFPSLVIAARGLLIGCACESGCPSCSGPLPRYHGAVRGAALGLIALLEQATRTEARAPLEARSPTPGVQDRRAIAAETGLGGPAEAGHVGASL